MAPKSPRRPSLTMAELREAFIADFGYMHPVFELDGWPTVEESKKTLETGLATFWCHYGEDGGRAGMLLSLHGALNYMRACLPANELELLDPLRELFRVLLDLECNGHKAACLSVKRRGNADSDAVADVKARALAIAEILKVNKGCSRKAADSEAAALISRAAKAVGITDHVDEQLIVSWRRSTRSRATQEPKGGGLLAPSIRRSLAERVNDIADEFQRTARLFAHIHGRVDLDLVIQAILNPEPDNWTASESAD